MIQEISFEEIKSIWLNNLWPNRQSKLGPISYIDFEGEINMSMQISAPLFFAKIIKNEIAGVVSMHRTNDLMRLRGLWVFEKYRGQGIACELIQYVRIKTKAHHLEKVWIMCRDGNQNFYKKRAFTFYKKTSAYEYGPHDIMWTYA